MVKIKISEKNQKESIWLFFALILALIFLFLFVLTIFNNNAETDNGYSQIPFAIHALEPALYADELMVVRFPGVKLSILWEILYDQNLSPEEVELRIRNLEKQLYLSIQEANTLTVARENNIEQPTTLLTPNPNSLNATLQSTNATLSLFGPNPFFTSTIISGTRVEHMASATLNPSFTRTLQGTPIFSVTPLLSSSRTVFATLTQTVTPFHTGSPTATNTVIWYPTFTFTSFPTNTHIPPTFTSTNTRIPPTYTFTSTPIPPTLTLTNTPIPPTLTPTYTPIPPTLTPTNTPIPPTLTPTNTPFPPTLTPTVAICNNTANQISVVFNPSNESVNIPIDIQPVVSFNQAMDETTFVYGGNNFTVALCEFDN